MGRVREFITRLGGFAGGDHEGSFPGSAGRTNQAFSLVDGPKPVPDDRMWRPALALEGSETIGQILSQQAPDPLHPIVLQAQPHQLNLELGDLTDQCLHTCPGTVAG